MRDCCKQAQIEARKALIDEALAWALAEQSPGKLIYRLRTVPIPQRSEDPANLESPSEVAE